MQDLLQKEVFKWMLREICKKIPKETPEEIQRKLLRNFLKESLDFFQWIPREVSEENYLEKNTDGISEWFSKGIHG